MLHELTGDFDEYPKIYAKSRKMSTKISEKTKQIIFLAKIFPHNYFRNLFSEGSANFLCSESFLVGE
jgi:hypothetical protein